MIDDGRRFERRATRTVFIKKKRLRTRANIVTKRTLRAYAEDTPNLTYTFDVLQNIYAMCVGGSNLLTTLFNRSFLLLARFSNRSSAVLYNREALCETRRC